MAIFKIQWKKTFLIWIFWISITNGKKCKQPTIKREKPIFTTVRTKKEQGSVKIRMWNKWWASHLVSKIMRKTFWISINLWAMVIWKRVCMSIAILLAILDKFKISMAKCSSTTILPITFLNSLNKYSQMLVISKI